MKHFERLDELLISDRPNVAIADLDTFIAEQCRYGDNLEVLTVPQRNFFYNQSLEKEVNNGGFEQYFLNSAGRFAHETLRSLRAIGAIKTSNLLQQAIRLFPGAVVPGDRTERVGLMKQVPDKVIEAWDELDQEFYAYEEDLVALNLNYVRQHKASF